MHVPTDRSVPVKEEKHAPEFRWGPPFCILTAAQGQPNVLQHSTAQLFPKAEPAKKSKLSQPAHLCMLYRKSRADEESVSVVFTPLPLPEGRLHTSSD
jgi:hypothetical protein